jgi:hypothetical protein
MNMKKVELISRVNKVYERIAESFGNDVDGILKREQFDMAVRDEQVETFEDLPKVYQNLIERAEKGAPKKAVGSM